MRKNTKRALIVSCLSLLLCASMLVGSTFAWFTDTDTATVSNIVSGTLDIEIVDANGAEKTTPLTFVNKDGISEIKWEPGATYRTEGFQLKNKGNLWLKYKIEINNTEVSYNKLNEVIKFSLVKENGTKIDLATMKDIVLAPDNDTTTTDVMYLEGTMSKDAGNDYQNLTMAGVSITVLAAQYTSEYDSNNNTYDKDAEYKKGAPTYSVPKNDDIPQTDIQDALNNGAGGTIDFGGSTIEQKSGSAYAIYYPKLPGNNSTIKNLNFDGSAYGLEMHGDITFENCTFTGQYAPNISDGENAVPGKVTFKNCTFQGWLSFAANRVTSAEFIDCKFVAGKHTLFMNNYQDTTFVNCTFDSSFGIDDELAGQQTWTFTNCTGLNEANLNQTGTYKTVTIIKN